jgi:hypothetical protein
MPLKFFPKFVPLLAGAVVFGVVGFPQAVTAQHLTNQGMPSNDPVMQLAHEDQPRDQFTLHSSQDVELVRFKSPHLLSVCVARRNTDAIGAAKQAYPLMVSFDEDHAVVTPGNCLSFEAQRVKVKPATELPQNVVLQGAVRVIR